MPRQTIIRATTRVTCSAEGCDASQSEPVGGADAVGLLHRRGWWLGVEEGGEPGESSSLSSSTDYCPDCTMRLQAAGRLGPRPTKEELGF